MYQYFSKLVPIRDCQKYRRDSEFTIITNRFNKFLYLNNTAADFFDLCDGSHTVDEIANCMLLQYDVEKTVLQQDLVKIIRDFQWNKIVKISKAVIC